MELKELRTKRDGYANTMRNIIGRAESEKRGLTAEEQRDFDGLKTKLQGINETLDRASQLGEIRADIERPIVSPMAQADSNGNGMIYTPRSLNPAEVRT